MESQAERPSTEAEVVPIITSRAHICNTHYSRSTCTVGFDGSDVSGLVGARCLAVVERIEVVGVALTAAVVELAAAERGRVVVPSDLVGEARPDVDRQLTVGRHVPAMHRAN